MAAGATNQMQSIGWNFVAWGIRRFWGKRGKMEAKKEES